MQISKQLGKYQIQQHLGSGGFADVYKAVDTELQRTVALKILKTNLVSNPDTVNRFIQEARTLARLDHPRIAWVWDLGEAEGQYFIAMRYIDGVSLESLIKEKKQLPWEEVVPIIHDVSEALAFAHQHNLVHRDIKPGNILINKKDGAVLSDFGLVKVMDSSGMTSTSSAALGTLAYMAPEILNGKPATPAADVFSLACVLVEMLTGGGPFHALTPQAIVTKHFMPLELPSIWPEGTPTNLPHILNSLLEQDPQKRATVTIFKKLTLQQVPKSTVNSVDANSCFEKAKTFSNQKNYDKALLYYSMAIDLNPKNATYYNNRGTIYHNKKLYGLAIQDSTYAIELDPDNASYYNNRGTSYYNNKQYDLAIQDYTRAINLDPADAVHYDKRGFSYHNNRQYDLAIQDYIEAIKLNPNNAGYYNNRGSSYLENKQYDLAIRDYTQAIKLNPNNAIYYNNRGNSYFEIQRYDLAIQDYTQAIKVNPNDAVYYNNRANSYFITHQHDLAIQEYTQAIKLNPKNAVYYNNRGNRFFETQQYNLAIQDYTLAIKHNPDDAVYYNNRANSYFITHQFELAHQDYTQAIKLNPNNAVLYNNRGEVFKILGKTELATQDFNKARELGY
jgi:tetratricopeptide (TPR) repeat protein